MLGVFGVQSSQNKAFSLEEQVNMADSDIKVQEENEMNEENKREKSNLELWAEDEVKIIEVESDITLGGLE